MMHYNSTIPSGDNEQKDGKPTVAAHVISYNMYAMTRGVSRDFADLKWYGNGAFITPATI